MDKTSKYFTEVLFPKNGVWMTPTQYPTGFSVARYDDKSFTSEGRWFETMEKADAYAQTLA